jgi:hypothetical protein
MYYISLKASGPSLSAKKKRLSDFKGEEGELYNVRKTAAFDPKLWSLPIYIFKNGRLRPTGNYSVYSSFL